MSTFTYQVLKDDTQHAVIKLVGKFDSTTAESNAARIVANSLYGALATNGYLFANTQGGAANTPLPFHGLSVFRIWYDCTNSTNADVELYWAADTPKTIVMLSGCGEYDGAGNWITMPNDAKGTANCKGDIGIATRGMAANNSYSIVLELRKDNAHYQRGQFNDPAAFNYNPYNLRP